MFINRINKYRVKNNILKIIYKIYIHIKIGDTKNLIFK